MAPAPVAVLGLPAPASVWHHSACGMCHYSSAKSVAACVGAIAASSSAGRGVVLWLKHYLVRCLVRFFEDYKKNEHKDVKVDDILGAADASQAVKDALNMYQVSSRHTWAKGTWGIC